jgi:RimJ/RimL family protein N-acetyltransferase
VRIRPWAAGDHALLVRLLGDPAMTTYIGGPESPEAIRVRHGRYLAAAGAPGGCFAIEAERRPEAVGWVGYWESRWDDQVVWECGWSVLLEFHGQGLATSATKLMIEHARAFGTHRYLHAFPSVDNAASNAVCWHAGFSLRGEADVEYPQGTMMRSNNWRLDLLGPG